MATEQTTAPTVGPVAEPKKGSAWTAVWIFVAVAVLAVVAYYARGGRRVRPNSKSERHRHSATGRAAVRLRALAGTIPDLHDHHDGHHHRGLCRGVAPPPGPPRAVDGHRHNIDRLAGPDHELVAIRGLQPATVALAGGLAAGVTVADGGAVLGDRVHHVLPGALLPGHLDLAQDSGPSPGRFVRLAPSTDLPGGDNPAASGSSSTRCSR